MTHVFVAPHPDDVALSCGGLIAGLRLAARIDPHASVLVRMDSRLVVEQMSGRWKIKHPDMKPLALRAGEAARGFAEVSYEWVPRERNKDADRLANEAMDAGEQAGGGRRSQESGRRSQERARPAEVPPPPSPVPVSPLPPAPCWPV